jgi:hypothetical protein
MLTISFLSQTAYTLVARRRLRLHRLRVRLNLDHGIPLRIRPITRSTLCIHRSLGDRQLPLG